MTASGLETFAAGPSGSAPLWCWRTEAEFFYYGIFILILYTVGFGESLYLR